MSISEERKINKMKTVKIFLASSNELVDDRNGFQILLAQLNQEWIAKDIF
jgi:hypothetical protein